MTTKTRTSTLLEERRSYFGRIKSAVSSILEGMSVTLGYLFQKPVTIQYPDRTEKPVREMLPERFRGILDYDVSKCSACLACMRACPIHCIEIEVTKDPETKKRYLTRFDIDIAKCMFCGLCVEPCPTEAIFHSHDFEGATWDVAGMIRRFISEPVEPYKPTKKAKTAEKPSEEKPSDA
jgi:NADH-quinone oxidoreductase subunit I/NAD(P)H-quinone oxidoreductase subunit I